EHNSAGHLRQDSGFDHCQTKSAATKRARSGYGARKKDLKEVARSIACPVFKNHPDGMVLMPSLSAGPFATRLAVVLPSERPELGGNRASACSGFVAGLFTASNVPTASLVRIRRFGDPCEFGAILSIEE